MLSSETAERVAGATSKLSRALRSSSHRWERLDIGMRRTDLAVLRRLQLEGEQRMSDLAEAQCVTPSVISRQVASLEQHGLVQRRSDPADARVGLITLTEVGRERLKQVTARYAEFLRLILPDWEDSEARRVADLLDEFADRVYAELERLERQTDVEHADPHPLEVLT